MRAFETALKAMAVAALVLVTGCGDKFPDYHYKLTIYAGGKAYSSVREVRVTEISSIQSSIGKKAKYELSGEAVVLDIPGRSTPVFALLARPDDADYATYAPRVALMKFIEPVPRDYGQDDMDRQALELQRMVAVAGPRELPRTIPSPWRDGTLRQTWPFFVTFGNIADPKSVREVSPDSIGVERITLEITDEPVTTGIEGRLTWRKGFPQGMLNGDRFERGKSSALAAHIGAFDFSTEPTQ